jgi:hypothetical protein
LNDSLATDAPSPPKKVAVEGGKAGQDSAPSSGGEMGATTYRVGFGEDRDDAQGQGGQHGVRDGNHFGRGDPIDDLLANGNKMLRKGEEGMSWSHQDEVRRNGMRRASSMEKSSIVCNVVN